MHEIRAYAVKNELKSSWTYYQTWGKKNKRKLRFSKFGENCYATHYVDVKRARELREERNTKQAETAE